MSLTRRLLLAAAWDGMLPIVVLASVFLVKLFFPGGGPQVIVAILFPVVASLARAATARNQLLVVCGGLAPIGRQFAIAAAIVLLLLFEASATALTFVDDEPEVAWLVPLGFYAIYLALIYFALRPMPQST